VSLPKLRRGRGEAAAEPPSATLASIAHAASDWPEEPPTRLFCGQVGSRLREVPTGTVAVVGGAAVPVWARVLREFLPGLTVVEVPDDLPETDAFLTLAERAPLDAIVDCADTAASQCDLFCRTLRHLRPGAAYLARLLPGEDDLWSLLTEAEAARVRDFPDGDTTDLAWLVRCLASFEVRGRVVVVVPERPGRAKLREEEVDRFLTARPDVGAVVATVPAADLVSRCVYDDNRKDRDPWLLEEFRAPPMRLRRYDGVTCSPRQLVHTDTVILPDTFRYNQLDRLVNIYLDDYARRFADPHMLQEDRTDLPGPWFHLDSEAPGAFGHFLTEQLPRLWAFEAARKAEPDLRVLMSLTKDRNGRLAPFELAILGAYGITEDDVHVIDRPVRVERLYAATPMYSYPDRGADEGGQPYVHPGVADVWRRIGDHLADLAGDAERPRRIFCARRPGGRRTCHNGDEVEALFARHGFTVIHPEDHPMPEQLAMFRAAEVVAGYAGSAMFTLALCPRPTRVISLAPDAYTGRNEYGISSVWGHRLTTVWSTSDVSHPPGGWTREAFWAPFTFDFDREGRFLERTLAELGGSGTT
jgi:capsular polysaccharide biosynthesis protein